MEFRRSPPHQNFPPTNATELMFRDQQKRFMNAFRSGCPAGTCAMALFAYSVVLGLAFIEVGVADELSPEATAFFESRIRPVLVKECYECHSADAKTIEARFRVDSRSGLRRGGDSGPAIVPGKPGESRLLHALKYTGNEVAEMPPSGKLAPEVIANFEKWIAMGAPDPRTDDDPVVQTKIDFAKAREFWSFRRPRRYAMPTVQQSSWPREPLDAFVLHEMESAAVTPADTAARRTLIRRVSYDLTGLPPTPLAVKQFVHDESPDAYERVVDRTLASPRYGERWGRHWLDVVRYAEDNTNMGPHNGPYPNAWRYRDWVVAALNEDVAYDEFVVRQLATDLLPETGPEDLPALGLFGLGPQNHKEVQLSRLVIQNRYADDWEDRVDVVGRGLLGLTLACARCHDHKYDPIRTADYYALAGVFASSRQTTGPIVDPALVEASEPARQRVKELEAEIAKLDKEIAARKKKEPQQGATAEETAKLQSHRDQVAQLKETPYFEVPIAHILTEETILVEETDGTRVKLAVYPDQPRDLPIFVRGNAGNHGTVVPRGFVEVLCDEGPERFQQGSGRLELARAIASPENPLTARVMVNRVWQTHFGQGLVRSPSNFGSLGERPTHPELLDDLAVRFVEDGWSLKRLHREIVSSATYQQSSVAADVSRQGDPDGRLWTRFPRRRLEIEPLRDAILAVAGRMDGRIGGPSQNVDDAEFTRRTIYGKVSRHELATTLANFDFPDPTIHSAGRSVTTTPLQQLFVLNAPFVRKAAMSLATELLAEHATVAGRVDALHERLYTRTATDQDQRLALAFLGSEPNDTERWTRYVHALLASNELQYVD